MTKSAWHMLQEIGTTFKPEPSQPQQQQQPGMGQSPPAEEEAKRWHSMPKAVVGYIRDIERMCSKLVRHNETDPELKTFVHKFLLDLNKYMEG